MGARRGFPSAGLRAAAIAVAVVSGASAPCAVASSTLASGSGPLSATAAVDISVRVPKVMRLRLVSHPAVIEVTEDDVRQGSVTIAGPSLDLIANDRRGYVLQAQLHGAAFTAVRIAHLQSDCVPNAEGCSVRMPTMVGKSKPAPIPVTYELKLAAGATPGRYAWPVALSLQDP